MRRFQLCILKSVLFIGLALSSANAFAFTFPNQQVTPGAVCTESDPDFSGYDYPSHVARCNRHVEEQEKEQVAHEYGDIPRSQWAGYEFDHLIPLCAGGSNDIKNLWPQPLDEAKEKDQVEDEVCGGLRAGTMTQDQAIARVWDWFNSRKAQAEF